MEYKNIQGKISGLCQPTYVVDIPGGRGKVPIGPNYLIKKTGDNEYLIEDYLGNQQIYPWPNLNEKEQ